MTTVIERDISANEAARKLGIGKRRMLRLLEEGRIPTAVRERDGGRWYIQPSGLLRYTRERGQ